MNYESKKNSREAWMRRTQIYWKNRSFPRFITRVGEIYEIDFGENVGTEFSGRHLAICLSDTLPSDEKMLVVPLTTKYALYNIAEENIITTSSSTGQLIKAGVVLREARWISKQRIFRASLILKDSKNTKSPVKGKLPVSKSQLKRWKVI